MLRYGKHGRNSGACRLSADGSKIKVIVIITLLNRFGFKEQSIPDALGGVGDFLYICMH